MTVPEYYRFGGVQVIDISRHLSSNGGQAVQYIARATRLDGRVKGDSLADLRKAADMIADEIERIESGVRQRFILGEQVATLDSGDGIDLPADPEELYAKHPRTWRRFDDVPVGVIVTDSDGDGKPKWEQWEESIDAANIFQPFTEVIE